MHTKPFLFAALSLSVAGASQAGTSTFTSNAALQSYVGSLQTETFNGIAVDDSGSAYLGNHYSNGPLSLTLGDDYLWAFSPDVYGTAAFTSTYLNNNGGGALDLVIGFATPMHAFGGFFGALTDFSNVGAQLKVTFDGVGGSHDLAFAETLALNPNGHTKFWGVYSDNAFSSLTLHDLTWNVAFDDLTYSSARHVNQPPVNGVPDATSSLLLAGLGLGALGVVRRFGG
ncbi:hypothetical protein [Nibricoccus sp. IMCC34717]|uniref:hypothetical protein n=1 Tax=Nibricoccus sp. IMCC34717 TaxID=3034021 RepID=UPI003850B7F2